MACCAERDTGSAHIVHCVKVAPWCNKRVAASSLLEYAASCIGVLFTFAGREGSAYECYKR